MKNLCKYNKEISFICAKNISIFSDLSDYEIKKIIKLLNKKEYIKGDVLCIEGKVCESLFFIISGQIKISKMTTDGKEQIIYVLNQGDFFGETNLFNNIISDFTATVIKNSKIFILSKENLENIIRKDVSIAIKILRSLTKKLSETENLVKLLATKDIDSRIANMLVQLINKYGEKIDNKIIIELPLGREDMANYCGVTRETISRKLSKFEYNNIIEIEGNKKIIIKDINRLKDIQ